MEATRSIKSVLGAKPKREAAHDVGVSDIVVVMSGRRLLAADGKGSGPASQKNFTRKKNGITFVTPCDDCEGREG
jgi:hypothetical protein